MLDELASKYEVPKNIQLIIASVLALGGLVYIAFIVTGIRSGRRRLGWYHSWGKNVRNVLLVVILAVWWIFWHTDIVLSHILGTLPDNAVTIRMLVPWPTAFVWISWAVTLLLLTWIAVTFVPKVKRSP